MSRSLQTVLIFLCLVASMYFVVASSNELYDLYLKIISHYPFPNRWPA